MITRIISSVFNFLNFTWLTGPIFSKELRVSSRRRRNYILRFVYILILTLFVATVWLSVVKYQGSAAYQKSRMALAGKTIITTLVTFQFMAIQLIAIIMLSTSISDEIYHRTLGVLMTTPISSVQIVMGKLFSKLLQLILLLAISLPLLAIVRIFGGVPWNYILSSLCITLTAVIFAGALSLYFSINNRRAYTVIIKTVVTLGVLFVFLPTIAGALLRPLWFRIPVLGSKVTEFPILIALLHLNPLGAMSVSTTAMMSPRASAAITFFSWPLHCVLMLCISSLLIAISVKIVRKVALRQATGQLKLVQKRKRRKSKKLLLQTTEMQELPDIIRPVKGSPVLWKELRTPLIQGVDRKNSIIGLAITIVALFITYALGAKGKYLDEDFIHVSYTLMFITIGSIFNMVLSATCITSEKESRTWPILLATSMDDWQILLGKAAGVFRRCLPIWLLLAGHVLLFILVKYIHPIAIVHLSMFVTGLVVFLIGVGLYFSTLLRRTTSAVVANFAFTVLLWVVIPAVFGIVAGFAEDYDDALEVYISANPMAQAAVIMNGACGQQNARMKLSNLQYNWPIRDWIKVGPTTAFLFIVMLIYIFIGFLFTWRAKCRFRRSVF